MDSFVLSDNDLMDTLIKADIFFFITSIAVVVVTIGILIGVYYVVGAVRQLEEYAERIENKLQERSDDVKDIADDVKGMAGDIRESFIYNLLFQKKKKRKNSK